MMRSALSVALILAAGAACRKPPVESGASLQAPTGMAVGKVIDANGKSADYLFIANEGEDSLQVVELSADLRNLNFVNSPARHFPLRIPAGDGPTDLATTPDQRFIVVLDAFSESLRLIAVGTPELPGRVVKVGSTPLSFSLGPRGSEPAAIIASPIECVPATDCLGRFFVALSGAGSVVEIDLTGSEESSQFTVKRAFNTGGEPYRLAIDRLGRFLYVSDLAAPSVARIDLSSGAVERRDVGAIAGPLAVSSDSRLLLVGRPALRDLLVLDDADGAGLSLHDSDPDLAPLPSCVACCAGATTCGALQLPDAAVCADAHPADQALCADGDGLHSTGQDYKALYLGRVPELIVTLGVAGAQTALTSNCQDNLTSHAEYAVVVGLDGHLRYVSLRDVAGGPVKPQLISTGACITPTLAVQKFEVDDATNTPKGDALALANVDLRDQFLDEMFEPCPTTPDRRRFACLEAVANGRPGGGGVVISPGATGVVVWELQWENILLKSNPGAGEFPCRTQTDTTCGGATNTFTDLTVDLSADGMRAAHTLPIQPGDILEILSPVVEPSRCSSVVGTNEWRILEVRDGAGGRAELLLDAPLDNSVQPRLDPSCFASGPELDYRVRAGDQFIATSASRQQQRLLPGQAVGPAGEVAHFNPESWRLRPRADLEAAGLLSRDRMIRVTINESLLVVQSGLAIDRFGTPTDFAGRMPAAALLWQPSKDDVRLFVSYSATDSVLGMVPSDANGDTMFGSSRYRILQ